MKLKILAYLSLVMLALSLLHSAHAQTFRVIHAFNGGTEGDAPKAGVVIHGGDLFGTTYVDGLLDWGSIYQAKRLAGDSWSIVPLSYLPISGGYPWSRALFGPDGHLYGTTIGGGSSRDGIVYSLTPPSSAICKTAFCPWQETELHSFSGTDGRQPTYGDLAWDQQGNVYGTTYTGGPKDIGTVFKMTPSENGWITESIYSFSGPDGAVPNAGVVIDRDGNLFGTTYEGGHGTFGNGLVFELKYEDGVGWQETVLHYFEGENDGKYPIGGLVFDNTGNLYGSAAYGGSGHGGTVFELSPSGDTWTFNLLYSLPGYLGIAGGPWAPLSFDTAGNLYGTTTYNGSHMGGNVFKLAKVGNGWTYTELHSFDPDLDGGHPEGSGVAIDADGTLYGTTTVAGPHAGGTLWMIKP